jgi:TolB-like protein/tetratricopeptide (TPR) repeat protein
MAENRRLGKLAVILHADIADSTTLVQQDEHIAHERIRDTFRRFSDSIEKYQGRVRELRGDALLAEFERTSDSVTAVLAFQAEQAEYITKLNDNIRPIVRVGIALGEVIIADSTVTGAGVVLAQRIEQLAEPGGLCITGAIHEALPQRMPFKQENLGEQQVKGFDEQIKVYAVTLIPGASIPEPEARPQTGTVALALPDKPSIAVLPFTNMSGDPEQEYFSDGITEDIITELSRFRSLFVIARNSSFHYKNQSPRVQDVGRELGVHYIVEGSVRKAGNRVRVTAQLIEAENGNHVWADRYDRDLENIFDVQDEVVREIAASVPGQLSAAAMDRARRRPAESLGAYDCLLHGEWLMFRDFTDPKVIPLFEQAIGIDPQCARAYIQLARLHAYSFTQGVPAEEAKRAAFPIAEKALEVDPSDPSIHSLAAATYMMMCEHELARQHMERAISLNPNDGEVMASAVFVLNYLGDQEEALRWNKKHLRHDPISSDGYRENTFDLYYMMRRYEDAIDVFRGWRTPPFHLFLEVALAYAQNGQPDEAKAAYKHWLSERPEGYDSDAMIRVHLGQCANPEDAEHWREGYRKLGLDV